jgi:hypothetical protein
MLLKGKINERMGCKPVCHYFFQILQISPIFKIRRQGTIHVLNNETLGFSGLVQYWWSVFKAKHNQYLAELAQKFKLLAVLPSDSMKWNYEGPYLYGSQLILSQILLKGYVQEPFCRKKQLWQDPQNLLLELQLL